MSENIAGTLSLFLSIWLVKKKKISPLNFAKGWVQRLNLSSEPAAAGACALAAMEHEGAEDGGKRQG